MNVFLYHIVFVIVLILVSAFSTRLMLKVGILAQPNHRSSHDKPTPSGGGVGFVVVIIVSIILFLFIIDGGFHDTQIFWLLGGSLIVAIAGFADDLGRLPTFKIKLLLQLCAVLMLFFGDLVVNHITIPVVGTISLGWWGYVITLIWVIGLTNVFNFMDGLDGIAAGTAIITAFFFAVIALFENNFLVFVFSYIIMASLFGFLPFNFPKAQLFMGDVGSQFLGFLFAALSVFTIAAIDVQLPVWLMPTLFLHFIFDAAFTVIRRLLSKQNITEAHRAHLYQLLNRLGWSHSSVSILYALLGVLQGLTVIFMQDASSMMKTILLLVFISFYTICAILIFRAARVKNLI